MDEKITVEASEELEQLISRAEAGDEVEITRNGEVVARLVATAPGLTPEQLAAARAAADRIKARPRIKLPDGETIRDLINAGRRY